MELLPPDTRSHIDSLYKHLLEYIDTRWDLIVLNLTEKLLRIISELVTGFILAIFGGIALVFLSIGAAIWLCLVLNNPFVGYFIMAGVFIFILVLALVFARNYLRTRVINSVLESIQDDDETEIVS